MRFSPTELHALHNSRFFYIKASVTKKMDALLAQTRDEIKSVIEKEKIILPAEADASMGKIFRGENYLGLPYLILDYPKYFGKDSVFAFRTLFWWGKFFSCTLHAGGIRNKDIRYKGDVLSGKGVYFCVNDSPWQYHYGKDNYLLIDKLTEKQMQAHIRKNNFIKLSRKMELKDYRKLPEFARETFELFMKNG
ncbi:MAG: hypothetical protein HY063_05590 [Bacteroidetes bacterium]|nr:hypothetical protein [Bacteroidota bacterium]